MNWDEAKPLLEAKLDPAHVKKPEGRFGPKGDYIEGWHAIAEANRIFGHDGWSYTIKSLTRDDLREGTDSKGQTQWQAAYTCIVTVQVDQVTREDVGFGSGFAKHPGDAIEGATKEAVTDALKRALRTFGWPFGLALYDKARANVGRDAPPPDPVSTKAVATAIHHIETCKETEELAAYWKGLAQNQPAVAKHPEVIAAKDAQKVKLAGITEPV